MTTFVHITKILLVNKHRSAHYVSEMYCCFSQLMFYHATSYGCLKMQNVLICERKETASCFIRLLFITWMCYAYAVKDDKTLGVSLHNTNNILFIGMCSMIIVIVMHCNQSKLQTHLTKMLLMIYCFNLNVYISKSLKLL